MVITTMAHRWRKLVAILLWIFSLIFSSRASKTVRSNDGSISASYDDAGAASGLPFDVSLTANGLTDASFRVRASANVEGSGLVSTKSTLQQGESSVVWKVEIFAANSAPFTAPLKISLQFGGEDANATNVWAPWDLNSYKTGPASPHWRNPLSPSGWQDGSFKYGTAYNVNNDMVVAPLVTFLRSDADAGLTLMLDPREVQLETQLDIRSNGSATFTRSNFRFAKTDDGSAVYTFLAHLVGHEADWRSGLNWTVAEHKDLWAPTSRCEVESIDGLGSYSWSTAIPSEAVYREMGYAVNWGLSGRFFPYMGMFLPPVDSKTETWCNDREGSQQKLCNISLQSIDTYYSQLGALNFSCLSYFVSVIFWYLVFTIEEMLTLLCFAECVRIRHQCGLETKPRETF